MKVLIMDEQSLFRDGLSLRLKQIHQDVTILQASSIDEMQKTLSQTPFVDVVIFDVDLAELNIGDVINKTTRIASIVVNPHTISTNPHEIISASFRSNDIWR